MFWTPNVQHAKRILACSESNGYAPISLVERALAPRASAVILPTFRDALDKFRNDTDAQGYGFVFPTNWHLLQMFSRVSSDIALYVLSILPLQDVMKLYTISRGTRQFLLDHEGAIFHQLAVLHRFVKTGTLLEDAVLAEKRHGNWLGEAKTWKDLCRLYYPLERNWSGQGTITEGAYLTHSSTVRMVNVDEEERVVLAIEAQERNLTTLSVRALEDGRLLWSLPMVYEIHLSDGYLLVRRRSGGIEIWRRARDAIQPSPGTPTFLLNPSPLAVTDVQIKECPLSGECGDATRELRGLYVPYGFLPSFTGAPFRVSYIRAPLLAVVDGAAAHTVRLYDIVQGILIRTFNLDAIVLANSPQSQPNRFVLLEIDLSEDHLCVCFDHAIVVVPLHDDATGLGSSNRGGTRAIILKDERVPWHNRNQVHQLSKVDVPDRTDTSGDVVLSQKDISCVEACGIDAFEVHRSTAPSPPVNTEATVQNPQTVHENACFTSARFSPNGRHIVAGTAFSLLYLFSDFQRVIHGAITSREVMETLDMKEPIRDLVWDAHNFRFVVRTEATDIFIVDLKPGYHTDVYSGSATTLRFAEARFLRLSDFSSPSGGASGNIVMQKSTLWFMWSVALFREELQKRLKRRGQTLLFGPQGGADLADHLGAKVSVCFVKFSGRP